MDDKGVSNQGSDAWFFINLIGGYAAMFPCNMYDYHYLFTFLLFIILWSFFIILVRIFSALSSSLE